MLEIKYGETTIDFSTLPAVSQLALARRGLAHFLGNEQASKVAAFFDGEPEPTPEAKAAKKAEFVEAAVKALMDGTVGSSNRGPRGTTIEVVMGQIARREVTDVLKTNKIKVPKADEKVKFQSGEELTMNELIDRRLAKHGDRIKKLAETEMRARERAVKDQGIADLV